MSLIYCPECGHEISNAAIACPNCGRPTNAAPPVDAVVVTPSPRKREGFPPWAIIPIGLAGLAFVFFLIYAMSGRDESADSNLNVNMRRASTRPADDRTSETQTTTIPPSSTSVTTVPPSAPDVQTVTVPGSQTSVPAGMTKGRVVIDAKVATRSGTPQAARAAKFYLLDKDLETILNDADLEPIEGQTLANSLGLSVLYPDRYGDFHRNALAAIRRHIKYSGTTDGSGRAQLANIEPDSYYLFGITRTGRGFALWSNPVSIQAGDNVLNLSPQQITEMDTTSLNRGPLPTEASRDTSE
jgi:hypothetical protein